MIGPTQRWEISLLLYLDTTNFPQQRLDIAGFECITGYVVARDAGL